MGANHPEVLSGKMSASDALKKVIHQLEVGPLIYPVFRRRPFDGVFMRLISDGLEFNGLKNESYFRMCSFIG